MPKLYKPEFTEASNIDFFRMNYLPKLDFDPTDWLKEWGFFTAPASTKYHGAEPGGLFRHSVYVTSWLAGITRRMELHWEAERSPYLIGLFHDLCKIDQYKADGDQPTYTYNTDTLLKGHGEKSVMLLSTLTKLTEEEVACIRYHMGAFTDKEQWTDYTNAIHRFPNVLWTHTADMCAAHVNEI